jgi:hypothetical protein
MGSFLSLLIKRYAALPRIREKKSLFILVSDLHFFKKTPIQPHQIKLHTFISNIESQQMLLLSVEPDYQPPSLRGICNAFTLHNFSYVCVIVYQFLRRL